MGAQQYVFRREKAQKKFAWARRGLQARDFHCAQSLTAVEQKELQNLICCNMCLNRDVISFNTLSCQGQRLELHLEKPTVIAETRGGSSGGTPTMTLIVLPLLALLPKCRFLLKCPAVGPTRLLHYNSKLQHTTVCNQAQRRLRCGCGF